MGNAKGRLTVHLELAALGRELVDGGRGGGAGNGRGRRQACRVRARHGILVAAGRQKQASRGTVSGAHALHGMSGILVAAAAQQGSRGQQL